MSAPDIQLRTEHEVHLWQTALTAAMRAGEGVLRGNAAAEADAAVLAYRARRSAPAETELTP